MCALYVCSLSERTHTSSTFRTHFSLALLQFVCVFRLQTGEQNFPACEAVWLEIAENETVQRENNKAVTG